VKVHRSFASQSGRLESFGFPMELFGNYNLPLVKGPDRDLTPHPAVGHRGPGHTPSPTTAPLYAMPLPAIEIEAKAASAGPASAFGALRERLHDPRPATRRECAATAGDGKALIASDNPTPKGGWTDVGRCPVHAATTPYVCRHADKSSSLHVDE